MTRTRLGSRKRDPSPDILYTPRPQKRQRSKLQDDNTPPNYKSKMDSTHNPNEYSPVPESINPLFDEIADLEFHHDYRSGSLEPYCSTPVPALDYDHDQEVQFQVEPSSPNKGVPTFIREWVPEFKKPGIVLSLKMWNIISHREFSKNWHHSLNYIVGNNGSGKSSAMTGFLLALGVKAAGVGKVSMKGCLNNTPGVTWGCVEIVLTHGGNLDPRIYGDTITIRRIIEKRDEKNNMFSIYQIRTAEGKWRKLVRTELDMILITLRIMVDNPLQFLNSFVAAKFLRVKTPKHVYTYYYRAMGLDMCENLIKKTKEDLEYAIGVLQTRKENLVLDWQNVANLKKDYDAIAALKETKDKLLMLQKEHVWSIVAQAEKEATATRAELEKITSEIDETRAKIKKLEARMSELKKRAEAEELFLQNLATTINSKQEERNRRHGEAEKVRLLNIQMTSLIGSIKKDAVHVQQLQAQLATMERDRVENDERRKRENEMQRIKLTEKMKSVDASLSEARGKKDKASQELAVLVAARNEQLLMIKSRQDSIDGKLKDLKNIDKVKRTQYDRFGNEMVRLMEKIKNNLRRFEVRPRGPQGACYTVKKEYKEYVPIIQYVMFGTIHSFKVTTQNDQNLLLSLIDDVYGRSRAKRPSIFITSDPAHQTVHRMKDEDKYRRTTYPRLLDMLDIVDNDPSVINWLADKNGVERILMFPSVDKACTIVKDSAKVPSSCKASYTQDFFLVNPVPNYSFYPLNSKFKASNLIQLTSSTQFSNSALIQQEIQQLKIEKSDLLAGCERQRFDLDAKNSTVQQAEREVKTLQNSLINFEKQVAGLTASFNNIPDIETYKEEIDYLNSSIKQKEEEKIQLSVQLADPNLESAASAVKRLESEITQAQNQKCSIESRSSAMRNTNRLNWEEEKLKKILGRLETEERKLIKKNREMGAQLLEKIAETEKKCERVETHRDGDTIKREIASLAAILDKNKAKLSQLENIKTSWKKAEKKAREEEEENVMLGRLITCVKQMVKLRRKHFEKAKLNYGISVTTNFNALISKRNYTGGINIDHDDGTLAYYIFPDSSAEANLKGNFKKKADGNYQIADKKGIQDYMVGLSGGERSFATFCLMVALWTIMDAPFYILDEFEVCMDAAHRGKCHEILLDHARNQPGAQFFFFTPTDIESMPSPSEACVLKLHPPVRNLQTNLNTPKSIKDIDEASPKKRARHL